MNVRIRPEMATDIPAIEAVTALAFFEAPHTSHTEQFIVNALRSAGELPVSLVAERDGEVIGHVAASAVNIADGAPGWFGLAPVSVLPRHQRHGVGSWLVREALEVLRERDAAGCVVLGEPRYYGRFGFRAEPGLVLPGVPPEYFLALSFGRSLPRGSVRFHEAFNARA